MTTYRSNFKREFSFESRHEEASRVLSKYPDKRPIICEKFTKNSDLPDIDKKKFLVPYELTMGEFLHVIRKRMRLNAQDALFLFVNEQIITGSAIIGHIYEALRDPDGFLYIYYAKESTFG